MRRQISAPTATYRLQLNGRFGFGDAAAIAGYLADLGVSHAYLSPILQPAPGSTHGYDVVEHTRLNTEAGGEEGFSSLRKALADNGLRAVADVVPNHMAVPTPLYLNRALWAMLRDGPGSGYAKWFDVPNSLEEEPVLFPVLGERLGTVLANGELSTERLTVPEAGLHDEPVLRYYDRVFPLRRGTEQLPMIELIGRQYYRLAWWRVGAEELNYRRFFDVDTLAAVRVELPEVFRATHQLLLDLVADGTLSGLRIDHPDGLADPAGYLDDLAAATGGVWVVVEKILEGPEELPPRWACDGTTGYDALQQLGGLFADSGAAAPLSALLTELTGESPDFAAVVEQAKREVVETTQYAEVTRLVDLAAEICHDDIRLRDHTARQLHLCLVELLVAFDRYRAYVVPGEPVPQTSVEAVQQACLRARQNLPEHSWQTLDLLGDLALARLTGDPTPEQQARCAQFSVRFQQTCGPVMAKGIEDTAFYRWFRLVALNEVGGDPLVLGVAREDFHAYAARIAQDWPLTMTTLSTHDTKRSEDVRARLIAATELAPEWAEAARAWLEGAASHRQSEQLPDASTMYLLWQTLVGTFDDETGGHISADRLLPYLEKATREAKLHTSWTQPDTGYDEAVASTARAVLEDEDLFAVLAGFCTELREPARVAVLGQKLAQLTMPGVPDLYQGCELVDLSLVDPDNRRPVDYSRRIELLAGLDAGGVPATLSAQKLLVTATALRLRRRMPEVFIGPHSSYAPLSTTTNNVLAFARGIAEPVAAQGDQRIDHRVLVLATRLPVALARRGGWGENSVNLPEGRWTDLLTPRRQTWDGGEQPLAGLLAELPVALLVREDDA